MNPDRKIYCVQHPEVPATDYCSPCLTPLCHACAAEHQPGLQHALFPVSKFPTELRQRLAQNESQQQAQFHAMFDRLNCLERTKLQELISGSKKLAARSEAVRDKLSVTEHRVADDAVGARDRLAAGKDWRDTVRTIRESVQATKEAEGEMHEFEAEVDSTTRKIVESLAPGLIQEQLEEKQVECNGSKRVEELAQKLQKVTASLAKAETEEQSLSKQLNCANDLLRETRSKALECEQRLRGKLTELKRIFADRCGRWNTQTEDAANECERRIKELAKKVHGMGKKLRKERVVKERESREVQQLEERKVVLDKEVKSLEERRDTLEDSVSKMTRVLEETQTDQKLARESMAEENKKHTESIISLDADIREKEAKVKYLTERIAGLKADKTRTEEELRPLQDQVEAAKMAREQYLCWVDSIAKSQMELYRLKTGLGEQEKLTRTAKERHEQFKSERAEDIKKMAETVRGLGEKATALKDENDALRDQQFKSQGELRNLARAMKLLSEQRDMQKEELDQLVEGANNLKSSYEERKRDLVKMRCDAKTWERIKRQLLQATNDKSAQDTAATLAKDELRKLQNELTICKASLDVHRDEERNRVETHRKNVTQRREQIDKLDKQIMSLKKQAEILLAEKEKLLKKCDMSQDLRDARKRLAMDVGKVIELIRHKTGERLEGLERRVQACGEKVKVAFSGMKRGLRKMFAGKVEELWKNMRGVCKGYSMRIKKAAEQCAEVNRRTLQLEEYKEQLGLAAAVTINENCKYIQEKCEEQIRSMEHRFDKMKTDYREEVTNRLAEMADPNSNAGRLLNKVKQRYIGKIKDQEGQIETLNRQLNEYKETAAAHCGGGAIKTECPRCQKLNTKLVQCLSVLKCFDQIIKKFRSDFEVIYNKVSKDMAEAIEHVNKKKSSVVAKMDEGEEAKKSGLEQINCIVNATNAHKKNVHVSNDPKARRLVGNIDEVGVELFLTMFYMTPANISQSISLKYVSMETIRPATFNILCAKCGHLEEINLTGSKLTWALMYKLINAVISSKLQLKCLILDNCDIAESETDKIDQEMLRLVTKTQIYHISTLGTNLNKLPSLLAEASVEHNMRLDLGVFIKDDAEEDSVKLDATKAYSLFWPAKPQLNARIVIHYMSGKHDVSLDQYGQAPHTCRTK